MSFIRQLNNPWVGLSKNLIAPPPSFDILETKDGFAYLKHLGFGTSKSDIRVVSKGTKVYLNVDRGESGTEAYSFSLLSNEKFKKAVFIEDIGLLLLYVTYSEVSEAATEHPIL